jgi:hypothetical protein
LDAGIKGQRENGDAYKEQWLLMGKCHGFVVILLAGLRADDLISEALNASEDARGALLNCHCYGSWREISGEGRRVTLASLWESGQREEAAPSSLQTPHSRHVMHVTCETSPTSFPDFSGRVSRSNEEEKHLFPTAFLISVCVVILYSTGRSPLLFWISNLQVGRDLNTGLG